MKKAISLLLVLSVLCLATSAMATPSAGSTSTSRSATTTFFNGTPTGRTDSMPGFRYGDTISFTVGDLTNAKELTVISYKCNDANLTGSVTLTDDNVQYINQYTVSGTTQDIRYTVRDQATGIYCLKMRDSNGGDVATFYYKIGKISDVTATMIPSNGTPYTQIKYPDGTYSIGFIGKATISSGVVDLGDIGATVGFTFTDTNTGAKLNNVTKTVSGATLDSYFNGLISANPSIEISGSYSVIYGITVYKVPARDKLTASAYKN